MSTRKDSPMYTMDAEELRGLLGLLTKLRATGEMTEVELRSFFLQHTLGGWYDPMCEGMDRNAGYLLYRLTDFVDDSEREAVKLYPGADDASLTSNDGCWITVNDWREEFLEWCHGNIPELPTGQIESLRLAITP